MISSNSFIASGSCPSMFPPNMSSNALRFGTSISATTVQKRSALRSVITFMVGMPSFLPIWFIFRNFSTSGRTLPGRQYMISRTSNMTGLLRGDATDQVKPIRSSLVRTRDSRKGAASGTLPGRSAGPRGRRGRLLLRWTRHERDDPRGIEQEPERQRQDADHGDEREGDELDRLARRRARVAAIDAHGHEQKRHTGHEEEHGDACDNAEPWDFAPRPSRQCPQ